MFTATYHPDRGCTEYYTTLFFSNACLQRLCTYMCIPMRSLWFIHIHSTEGAENAKTRPFIELSRSPRTPGDSDSGCGFSRLTVGSDWRNDQETPMQHLSPDANQNGPGRAVGSGSVASLRYSVQTIIGAKECVCLYEAEVSHCVSTDNLVSRVLVFHSGASGPIPLHRIHCCLIVCQLA